MIESLVFSSSDYFRKSLQISTNDVVVFLLLKKSVKIRVLIRKIQKEVNNINE